LCIAVILFAAGVTAVHHHVPTGHHEHNCEICSFLNVVNAAILPAALLFWVLAVFAAIISKFNSAISSDNTKLYPSRAPPFILE
jgi:hypothetical protein